MAAGAVALTRENAELWAECENLRAQQKEMLSECERLKEEVCVVCACDLNVRCSLLCFPVFNSN